MATETQPSVTAPPPAVLFETGHCLSPIMVETQPHTPSPSPICRAYRPFVLLTFGSLKKEFSHHIRLVSPTNFSTQQTLTLKRC